MGAQQVEVLGVERRRRWSQEAKAAIVAEASRPGASVSFVARRHGLHPNQVFTWRRALREGSRRGCRSLRYVWWSRRGREATASSRSSLRAGDRLRVDGAVDAEALRRVIAVLDARR